MPVIRSRRVLAESGPARIVSRQIERMRAEVELLCRNQGSAGFARNYLHAIEQASLGNRAFLEFIGNLWQLPVDIETFIDSPDFMGSTDLELWPEVRRAVIEINQNWFMGREHGAFSEYLGMGATGTGKSEIAKVSCAYHLHLIGCMKSPQTYWGLPSATPIVLPIFAAKPKVTKNILYTPLQTYVKQMPWFRKHMRPNKYYETEMIFDAQNVRVTPVGADVDSILGEAIFAGIIDEVNFMQVVVNSKKAEARVGRSAKFDQAQEIFNKVTRRKTGRFSRRGPSVGVICTLSSTNFPGEFTDRRKKQVIDMGLKHVYVYQKAQYEVKPDPDADRSQFFYVCIHNEGAKSVEVREKTDEIPKNAEIYEVPERYRDDFMTDAEGSVRDVIGRSLSSQSPFITRRSAVTHAIELGRAVGIPDIVENMNVDLGVESMMVNAGHFCRSPTRPRYVHIDLSHISDRCGIAMVRYDGKAEMKRRDGTIERLPTATVELAVSMTPSSAKEVDLAEVRAFALRLKDDCLYPIRGVSYDGWNSLESRQQWRKQGMPTMQVTVDKAPSRPYKAFREALYDGRIALPDNSILIEELLELCWDGKTQKVDHLPSGSKDIADAVVGAYWTLLTRSATWTDYEHGGSDRMSFGERPSYERSSGQERVSVGQRA